MKKYRAGIIGCGNIGRKHALAYSKIDNIELIAGADPSDRRYEEYKMFGIKHLYKDAQTMLANENLDIVSVCTGPSMHATMTILSAESKVKGIICEKPMARDLIECDAMIDACKANNVKLAIGHQRRYGKQFLKGLEIAESGILGKPILLWAMTPGSDVMTWGVHWIDMFHFYMKGHNVECVMGLVDVQKQQLTGQRDFVENALISHMTFDDKTRAILECGDIAQLEPDFPTHATIRIYGKNGRFEANDIGYTFSFGDKFEHVDVVSPFEQDDIQMWIDQVNELIDCIENNKEHQCNGKAGRKTIEIACATWKSARDRQLVKLPLKPEKSPLFDLWKGETKPWEF
jgi:predicted dehydrogenase